ncbi:hypothetical protein D3C87_1479540 [compost metagenome]
MTGRSGLSSTGIIQCLIVDFMFSEIALSDLITGARKLTSSQVLRQGLHLVVVEIVVLHPVFRHPSGGPQAFGIGVALGCRDQHAN